MLYKFQTLVKSIRILAFSPFKIRLSQVYGNPKFLTKVERKLPTSATIYTQFMQIS